jgi:hypothetical protein
VTDARIRGDGDDDDGDAITHNALRITNLTKTTHPTVCKFYRHTQDSHANNSECIYSIQLMYALQRHISALCGHLQANTVT